MSADGEMVDPVVSEAFSEIAKLEKDFATVELDSSKCSTTTKPLPYLNVLQCDRRNIL